MKKLFIVLLAVLLFALPVMAQEQDTPVEISWEGEMEDSFIEKEYAGKFYLFEDYGIQFLVPGGMEPVELDEEDEAHGVFAYFEVPDAPEMHIVAQFLDYGVDTLEEVAMFEKEQRGDDMLFGGYYVLNGLNAIMFVDTDSDAMICNIGTSSPQQFIKITLTPISNEELNARSGYILASIQPYSAE